MLVIDSYRAIAAIAVVALVLSACASSTAGGPGGTTATSPPAPEPISHLELDPREIRIAGEPDVLGVGFGAIWVKADAGTVTRIDPTTAEVLEELQVHGLDDTGCSAMGIGSTGVWSCVAGDLVRIDPATNDRTEPAPTKKVWSQIRFVAASGRIWVLTGDGSTLIGLEEASGAVSDPIVLPVPCTDLGSAGDRIFVVCEQAGRVLLVDPVAATVTADVPATSPRHVSATGDDAWVSTGAGLLQLDPASLATRRTFADLRVGEFGALRADEAGVWVRRIDPFLTRIEASTGAISHVIEAPFEQGGDVLVDGDHLWATTLGDGVVLRLEVPGAP